VANTHPPRILAALSALALCAGATAQSPVYVRLGNSPAGRLGQSLALVGDHDGDGRLDVVIGIPGDNPSGPSSGSAFVTSGPNSSKILNLIGRRPGDQFGAAVASAGDIDCDGVVDILVGAPGACVNGRSSGSAYVFSGRTAEVLIEFDGEHAGDALGSSVAGAGDIDGDGVPEIAVGAPGARQAGFDSGSVRVYSGADASILYTFHGAGAGDRFGCCVAGGADHDADGVPDVVVGAFQPRGGPGYARVLSGRDASLLYTFGGQEPGDGFGISVAALDDLDGDGGAEILVGAFRSDEFGYKAGSAGLFSGKDGVALATFLGDGPEDRFGACVTALGDVDGDGTPDLAVGAPQPHLPQAGYLRIFSGSDFATLTTLVGAEPGHQFGIAAASLGDFDDDGLSDLIVGAWADSTKGVWTGSVAAFSGAEIRQR
jgi:hypothetical protein